MRHPVSTPHRFEHGLKPAVDGGVGGRASFHVCDIRQEAAVRSVVTVIVFLLSPAARFISGTVLRVDGARPQVRMGWGQVAAPVEAQGRDAVKPFEGFHRYVAPKVFQA